MNSAAREILSRHGFSDAEERLREFLPRQRWFGGREHGITSLRVTDVGVLRNGDPTVLSVIVDVEYASGEPERYHVPLALQTEGTGGIWEGMVVGSGERDGKPVLVYDALHGGLPSFALWQVLGDAADLPMEHGRLRPRTMGFELGDEDPDSVHPLGREQSNSSLVRGDREVMKCFRKLARGRSPELEMLQALSTAGFANVAAPLGVIEYDDGVGEPALVAMLQPYLHNGTDGWTLALASLRDLYAHSEEVGTQERRHPTRVVREQGASFEPESERMARVTAQMHLALSRMSAGSEMLPEAAAPEILQRWSKEMLEDFENLLARGGLGLSAVDQRRASISALFQSVAAVRDGGLSIRYHGDYHLGQLLRTDGGWTILDFEGEPARGAETRRSRSSPLRDVAGMMRSFDYAAEVELRSWAAPGDPDFERMSLYGDAWARVNREAFWSAYLDELGDSRIIPGEADAVRLRRAFELQKAVYEVGYELGHRPEWVDIPLRFLTREDVAARDDVVD
ncbi:MAG: maltokinase N-terminal cap-like domain-containing protein [Candidatus Dormibacteria bacterium]